MKSSCKRTSAAIELFQNTRFWILTHLMKTGIGMFSLRCVFALSIDNLNLTLILVTVCKGRAET